MKKTNPTISYDEFYNLVKPITQFKRIDDRIWNSWKKGMDDIYNKSEIIRKQWQEEIKNDGWKSFYLDKPTSLFN